MAMLITFFSLSKPKDVARHFFWPTSQHVHRDVLPDLPHRFEFKKYMATILIQSHVHLTDRV
jgi:hypothetical protein